MEKIKFFKSKENYGHRNDMVEMYYEKRIKEYIVKYKYSSMKEFISRNYLSKELAEIDFMKKVLFILS